MENGYYPAGAYDDPRAPYNELPKEEKEFYCTVTETLKREASFKTDEYDDYGELDPHDDLAGMFHKEHYSITELLAELSFFAKRELESVSETTGRGRYLKEIIRECADWTEVETEVELT